MGLRKEVSFKMELDQFRFEKLDSDGKVLILVEGIDDETFYFRFFDHNTTNIRRKNGSQGILEFRKYVENNSPIVAIVIKDSDFGRLNDDLSKDENVFYADGHDYEMMCFMSEKVRHDLLENNRIAFTEVPYDETFDDLTLLSYIQWFNYTNHLGYDVSKVSVANKDKSQLLSFDILNSEISLNTLRARKKHAKNSGINPDSVSVSPIKKDELDTFMSLHPSPNKYEITRGHSFVERLIVHMKKLNPELGQLNEDKIKGTLNPCYGSECFRKTNLYSSLLVWEEKNGRKILSK